LNLIELSLNKILQDPAIFESCKPETRQALADAYAANINMQRQVEALSVTHNFLVNMMAKSQPFQWRGFNAIKNGRWLVSESNRFPSCANDYTPKPINKNFTWTTLNH
jgi:hypothetical protein